MQGFNRYYAPDHDPKKTLNQAAGVHALGHRARKIKQGILIVRFELPFNVWCEGCGGHVGQGVRYNAEKKKTGMYYTTPTWSFRMKCHLCTQWFEIHTDPKNAEYVVVSGAKRRAEPHWDTSEAGAVKTHDPSEMEDPFQKLEKSVRQEQAVREDLPDIERLRQRQERQWLDPFAQSQKLRRAFRDRKRVLKEASDALEGYRSRNALHIRLVDEEPADIVSAQHVDFGDMGEALSARRLKTARQRGLFQNPSNPPTLKHNLMLNQAAKSDPFMKDTTHHHNTRSRASNLVSYSLDER